MLYVIGFWIHVIIIGEWVQALHKYQSKKKFVLDLAKSEYHGM